jgi:uncharacterized protein YkwD
LDRSTLPELAFFSPASRLANRSFPLIGLALLTAILAVLLVSGSLAPASAEAGLIAPAKACPVGSQGSGKAQMGAARRAMTCMVNYARRKDGLWRYHRRSQLAWSAERKARDIQRCGFAHSACGRQFDYWIKRSGYLGRSGWATGENIAWGGGSLGNVRSIFVAWMKSRGHREAILSRTYTDVGAGLVKGRFQGVPGAGIWVLHFGRN